MAEKVYKDSDFLKKQEEILKKEAMNDKDECKFYGAYTDYNGLDVKKLKNPIFSKK